MAPLRSGAFCFRHSPATALQRRAASSKGGRHNRTPKASQPADVDSVSALQRAIGQVLADVLLRDNTEKRALAVARLAEVARRLIEVGEVERRLDALEQRLHAEERGP